MGDMADMYSYDYDEQYEDQHDEEPLACKRCNSTDVYWDSVRGANNKKVWVLKDTGTLQRHDCGNQMFDDIPDIH